MVRTTAGRLSSVASLDPPRSVFGPDDAEFHSGHAGVVWEGAVAADWRVRASGLYDAYRRRTATFDSRADTVDVDVQAVRSAGGGPELTVGAGARWQRDEISGGTMQILGLPPVRRRLLGSGFARYEWADAAGEWRVSAGLKVENDPESGVAWQPSVRAAWTPSPTQTVWGAVTRAARTPSRSESGFQQDSVLATPRPDGTQEVTVIRLSAERGATEAEELVAVEAGWRWQPNPRWAVEAAVFWNDYADLIGTRAGPTLVLPDPERTVLVFEAANALSGEGGGGEVSVWWEPARAWRVTVQAYVALFLHAADRTQAGDEANEKRTPELQGRVDVTGRPSPSWDLTTAVRVVSPIQNVAGYAAWDARVAWRPRVGVEVFVAGRNLADPGHTEAQALTVTGGFTEVPREVRTGIELTW